MCVIPAPARRAAGASCGGAGFAGPRAPVARHEAEERRTRTIDDRNLEVLERRRAKEDECDAVATAERSSSKKAKRLVEVIALHCERGSERGEQG